MVKRKKARHSYNNGDIYDMPMILDNPSLLNKAGKKKRIQWNRRSLL